MKNLLKVLADSSLFIALLGFIAYLFGFTILQIPNFYWFGIIPFSQMHYISIGIIALIYCLLLFYITYMIYSNFSLFKFIDKLNEKYINKLIKKFLNPYSIMILLLIILISLL